uniref:Uncharacterized protein n=1 Tax=Acrobeloides nanus TaxID=290746 RepID=A0A914CY72_9BILA
MGPSINPFAISHNITQSRPVGIPKKAQKFELSILIFDFNISRCPLNSHCPIALCNYHHEEDTSCPPHEENTSYPPQPTERTKFA